MQHVCKVLAAMPASNQDLAHMLISILALRVALQKIKFSMQSQGARINAPQGSISW